MRAVARANRGPGPPRLAVVRNQSKMTFTKRRAGRPPPRAAAGGPGPKAGPIPPRRAYGSSNPRACVWHTVQVRPERWLCELAEVYRCQSGSPRWQVSHTLS